MAINKRKVLETARKYVQKGAQSKALKEFEKLLKADPRDARLRLEIGDAYRRWGDVERAVDTYMKVATQFMKEGFDARAVAVYKQIHNLNPEAYETYEPLAEVYQRMGLTAEAILALQTAADGFHKEGKRREALELLRKMAMLDPTNTASRVKVADLLRQEKLHEEAIAEYEEAIAELERQGDHDAAGSVYERILEIDPKRIETTVGFARNLLARGLADRAEPLAKRAVDKDPDTAGNYELLAEVYRTQRRDDELANTYRHLSELYRRQGDEDRARELLQRFVPTNTFDVEAGGDLGIDEETVLAGMSNEVDFGDSATSISSSREAKPPPLSHLGEQTVLQEIDLGSDSSLPRDEELLGDSGSPYLDIGGADEDVSLELDSPVSEPEVPREVTPAPMPPQEPIGDPDQLLAEASVYLRYGKRDQAIANLEAVVAQDPRHRAALEKLGDAYADAKQGPKAVETWLAAATLAGEAGDREAVRVLRDRIAAIDEAVAATLEIPAPGAAKASDESTAELSIPADLQSDEEDTPAVGAGASGVAEGHEIDLDDIEIDIDDSEFEDAARPAEVDSGIELQIDSGGTAGSLDIEIDEGGPHLDAGGASEAATGSGGGSSASTSMAQQIFEDLEEADFYMQQGLADEAEIIYKRVLSIAPNHPHALVRLGEVAALRGEDPAATGPSPTSARSATAEPESATDSSTAGELEEQTDDFDDLADDLSEPDFEMETPSFSAEAAAGALEGDTLPETEPEPEAGADPNGVVEIAEPGDSFGAAASDMGEPPDLVAPAADAGERESGFDLAAELSFALDDDSASATVSGLGDASDGFEAVFQEFKKGVSRTLSENDHEAHFDLGIAYREMGLLEDAKNEFRAAMLNRAREVECLHMLGLCCFEQEQFEEAVAHFEQILGNASLSDEQKLTANFEMGRSCEALGDRERARGAYQAVVAFDPSFCEVEARLAALDEPEKPEAFTDDLEGGEEDFESFEDLISDADAAEKVRGVEAEPATQEYESFEDFLSDDEVPEPSAGDVCEIEPRATPEPAPALDPVVETPDEPVPSPRKKKKRKISFV